MVQKRDIALAIIFSLITCGIYGIHWLFKLNDDVNTLVGDTSAMSGGMVFLLSIVTCGIFNWVWLYQMGTKLDNFEVGYGKSSQMRPIVYILLGIFGLSIVSYALMQDTLNRYAAEQ